MSEKWWVKEAGTIFNVSGMFCQFLSEVPIVQKCKKDLNLYRSSSWGFYHFGSSGLWSSQLTAVATYLNFQHPYEKLCQQSYCAGNDGTLYFQTHGFSDIGKFPAVCKMKLLHFTNNAQNNVMFSFGIWCQKIFHCIHIVHIFSVVLVSFSACTVFTVDVTKDKWQ